MPHQRLEGGVAIITGGIDSAAREIYCKEGAKVAPVDQDADTVKTAAEEIRCLVPGAQVADFMANLAEKSAAQIVVDNVLQASPRNGYEVAEMPQLHIIPPRYSADLFSLGPRERGQAGMAASGEPSLSGIR